MRKQPIVAMAALALASSGALATETASTGSGQGYPARPIRLVVGSAPGGGNDFVARAMNQRFSEALGNQLVIDNRGGAGGLLASEIVAQASPDGYTLLQMFSNFVILPSLYKKLSFDVVKDFAPVGNFASSPLILVVNPSLPANSVTQLIELARSRKGKLNFAAPGVGSLGHLAGELFKSAAKIEMTHVPYKGGGPAITALVANEVNLYFSTVPAAITQVKAGRLRALGVTSLTRSSVAPEVPTIAESGLPNFNVVGWFGMFAPARTPPAVVKALNAGANKTLGLQEVRARFLSEGVEAVGGTPEAFASLVRQDVKKWNAVAAQAGIKPE
jgi:tripartite-type tricarboxylate transporter receptor subunit TctC